MIYSENEKYVIGTYIFFKYFRTDINGDIRPYKFVGKVLDNTAYNQLKVEVEQQIFDYETKNNKIDLLPVCMIHIGNIISGNKDYNSLPKLIQRKIKLKKLIRDNDIKCDDVLICCNKLMKNFTFNQKYILYDMGDVEVYNDGLKGYIKKYHIINDKNESVSFDITQLKSSFKTSIELRKFKINSI